MPRHMSKLWIAVLVTPCAVGACAGGPIDTSEAPDAFQATQAALGLQAPSGYFSRISADGSGCPPGSWVADISDDGEAFSIAFSAFVADLGPGAASNSASCTLDIAVRRHRDGPSFGQLAYSTYSSLEPGVTGALKTDYRFADSAQIGKRRHPLPDDADSLFVDDAEAIDAASAPCEAAILHVHSKLKLKNDADATGNGYANVVAIDGAAMTLPPPP